MGMVPGMEQMNPDPILEKIKKLLRMKRGGTPDEIATALRLAQELAAKHGIDLENVNENDDHSGAEDRLPITHVDAFKGNRIQFECQYVGLLIDQFFRVSVFTSRDWYNHRLVFVGTDSNIQIATYVFKFLVGHFRRQWNTKRGRCRNRQAFLFGMYIGLSAKLRESIEEKTASNPPQSEQALQVISRSLVRREDYIAKNFGEMSSKSLKPDSNAEAAKWAGWVEGQKTEIRPGVSAPKEERLMLS